MNNKKNTDWEEIGVLIFLGFLFFLFVGTMAVVFVLNHNPKAF